jgi:hypothetical protein
MKEWLRFFPDPHYAPDDGASGSGGGDTGSGEAEGGDGGNASGGDEAGSSSEAKSSYPDFHRQFPENLRGHKALKEKTIGEIVQGYVDFQERGVLKPGEDATPEERDKFARAIGRPDGPDGYTLRKPDDWPQSVPWSEQAAKDFAAKAYEAGLSKDQAMRLYQKNLKEAKTEYLTALDGQMKQQSTWDSELRETFGDNLDRALNTADRAMTLIGEPSVAELLKAKGIARHPGVVRMLNKAWNSIGEDKIFSGAVDAAGAGPSSKRERLRSRYSNTNWNE